MRNNATNKTSATGTKTGNPGPKNPRGVVKGGNPPMATTKAPIARAQQKDGNYRNGPGTPTQPVTRGVPPKTASTKGSYSGPGAKGTPHGGTFPALPVGSRNARGK